MKTGRLQTVALATLASLSACFYSFDNPVERQPGGSISGKLNLEGASAGQSLQGGTVSVLWSNLTVRFTSDSTTAPFTFFSLPDGTYTLTYQVPDSGVSGPLEGIRPNVALESTVLVGYAPDALNVGTLSLSEAGIVQGTVAGATGTTVVGAFLPTDGGQLGTFEAIEALVGADGSFALVLPAGAHTLAASDSAQFGMTNVTVSGGASQAATLTLAPTPVEGSITGNLVLGEQGANASTTIDAFLADIQIGITDSAGNTVVFDGGPLTQTTGEGAELFLPLPSGDLYTLTFTLPGEAGDGGIFYPQFTIGPIPVLAGQGTALNQVTWLTTSDLQANVDAGTRTGGTTGTTGGTSGGTTGGTSGGPSDSGWQVSDAGVAWTADDAITQVAVYDSHDAGQTVVWADIDGGVFLAQHSFVPLVGDTFTSTVLVSSHGSRGAESFVGMEVDGGVVVAWLTRFAGSGLWANFQPTGSQIENPPGLPFSPNYSNPSTGAVAEYQGVGLVEGTLANDAGVFFAAPSPDGGVLVAFTTDFTHFTPAALLPLIPDGGPGVNYTVANLALAPLPGTDGGGFGLIATDATGEYIVVAAVSTTTATPTPNGPVLFFPWPGEVAQLTASLADVDGNLGILVNDPGIASYFGVASEGTSQIPFQRVPSSSLLLDLGGSFFVAGSSGSALQGAILMADGGLQNSAALTGVQSGLPLLGGYADGTSAHIGVVNTDNTSIGVASYTP